MITRVEEGHNDVQCKYSYVQSLHAAYLLPFAMLTGKWQRTIEVSIQRHHQKKYKTDPPSVPVSQRTTKPENPRRPQRYITTAIFFFQKQKAGTNITSASICNMYPTRSSNSRGPPGT